MLEVGDKLPEIDLRFKSIKGIETINTKNIFHNRFIVMIGVPGAFTSTCSNSHLPGFVKNCDPIFSLGVEEIACVSVNDPYVMYAWGQDQNVSDKINLYSDVDASFARSISLYENYGPNLLVRLKRFAVIAKNNVVKHISIDQRGSFKDTSAEKVISILKQLD